MHKIGPFRDKILIYHSSEDECWIAHSLQMDQIGTGDCVVNAIADLMITVRQILDMASKDSSIRYLNRAPKELFARAKKAKLLPEIFADIARERAAGRWLDEFEIQNTLKRPHPYMLQIEEPLSL